MINKYGKYLFITPGGMSVKETEERFTSQWGETGNGQTSQLMPCKKSKSG